MINVSEFTTALNGDDPIQAVDVLQRFTRCLKQERLNHFLATTTISATTTTTATRKNDNDDDDDNDNDNDPKKINSSLVSLLFPKDDDSVYNPINDNNNTTTTTKKNSKKKKNQLKKIDNDETWKEDTAGYGVPFVGTSNAYTNNNSTENSNSDGIINAPFSFSFLGPTTAETTVVDPPATATATSIVATETKAITEKSTATATAIAMTRADNESSQQQEQQTSLVVTKSSSIIDDEEESIITPLAVTTAIAATKKGAKHPQKQRHIPLLQSYLQCSPLAIELIGTTSTTTTPGMTPNHLSLDEKTTPSKAAAAAATTTIKANSNNALMKGGALNINCGTNDILREEMEISHVEALFEFIMNLPILLQFSNIEKKRKENTINDDNNNDNVKKEDNNNEI